MSDRHLITACIPNPYYIARIVPHLQDPARYRHRRIEQFTVSYSSLDAFIVS